MMTYLGICASASAQPLSARRLLLRQSSRRGVLLIVVLSLLTLFMLLGTTYIVLASRARTVSRAYLQLADEQSRSTTSLRPLLREAAMQVIRGTTKTGSGLRYHDLLRDRYGNGCNTHDVSGVIRVAPNTNDCQLIQLTVSPAPGQCTGRVLTFLSGPQQITGWSTRIVEGSGSNVTIIRPSGLTNVSDLAVGTKIGINDVDFNGIAPSSSPLVVNGPTSYLDLPNWAGVLQNPPAGTDDESWDAFDRANMALSGAGAGSFFRPSLFDGWLDRYSQLFYGTSPGAIDPLAQPAFTSLLLNDSPTQNVANTRADQWALLQAMRRSSIRPFALDHPQDNAATIDFTGKPIDASGLWNTLTTGLDVDNDGDGSLDSVWIDFGEQPFRMLDGTLVKPLAAIQVRDLGGRLNVNTHGSPAHVASLSWPSNALALTTGTGTTPTAPPTPDFRGLGFGVTDVRLDKVLSSNEVDALLFGTTLNVTTGTIRRSVGDVVGRYGDGLGSNSSPARPGIPPSTPSMNRPAQGLFSGGPSDYWGRLAVALDHRGHPIFHSTTAAGILSDAQNTPYELNLLAPREGNPYVATGNIPTWGKPATTANWVDQPFTAAEMEAVLRAYDSDNASLLPQRLLGIVAASGLANKDVITTDSWETPAVIGDLPGIANPDLNVELSRRLRMDLNRPFGDGQDSDGDGIVDEPDETGLGLNNDGTVVPAPAVAVGSDPAGAVMDDTNGDGALDNNDAPPAWSKCGLTRGITFPRSGVDQDQPGPPYAGLRARQIMAANLFDLFKALSLASLTPLGIADKDFAQWAVNVVDFVDSDAIMTPFRYGATPTDTVWGCEQPDLIITETLAFHDRAIADTAQDDRPTPELKDVNDPAKDQNFDQIRVPQGSLFVELYAVRSPNSSLPRELYSQQGGAWKLDLGKTPTGTANESPIWRLSFTPLHSARLADDDPFLAIRANPSSEWLSPDGASTDGIGRVGGAASILLSRYVWFNNSTPPTETSPSDPSPNRWNTFTLKGGTSGGGRYLEPGNYLVVGPREKTVLGSKQAADFGEPSSQEIILGDAANANVRPVVRDASGSINPSFSSTAYDDLPPPDAVSGSRPETQGCWVQARGPGWANTGTLGRNHAIGLNLSEKRGDAYYTAPPAQGINGDFASTPYGPIADAAATYPDTPQDLGSPLNTANLLAQGTHLNVATVFLERLADPTRAHDARAQIGSLTNPDWNPYIVVDFMPIDMTVFNGETRAADTGTPANGNQPNDVPFYFHTRQRGFDDSITAFSLANVMSKTPLNSNRGTTKKPWQPLSPFDAGGAVLPPQAKQTIATKPASDAHFAHELGLVDSTGNQHDSVPFHTLGWGNLSYGRRLTAAEAPNHRGATLSGLPWIVWHDRPFGSHYELVYVPRTPASRLLTNYRDLGVDTVAPGPNGGVTADAAFGADMPGSHLIPLTSITDRPDGSGETRRADALSKIFQYVRVRSPHEGTYTKIDSSDPSTPVIVRAPFDKIPTYREPGGVNINTISSSRPGDIWRAICGWDEPPSWNDVTTTFRNPLVAPFKSGGSTDRSQTLFGDIGPGRPLFGIPAGMQHTAFSPEQSAWFRFQPLIRAASNTTTRSEVYAMWVTIGLFEVTSDQLPRKQQQGITGPLGFGLIASDVDRLDVPLSYDPNAVRRYPDGYRLVREYGSSTGTTQRYRAFYLFDRSVPVCYEPGADHNVRNAVLIERFLE